MGNWMINLFQQLLCVTSGPIREMLNNFAKELRANAKETTNPWDDILADVVCWLLAVPETPESKPTIPLLKVPGAAGSE